MGGSDQWGNITAGIELIRKVARQKAHGLVWPLMTTAAGTKFGKTEAGTVWLDPQRTSPFKFYQFWLNADDRDVIKYLKFFTWLDRAMIDALEKTVSDAPATARRAAHAGARSDDDGARRGGARARRARLEGAVRRIARRRLSRGHPDGVRGCASR